MSDDFVTYDPAVIQEFADRLYKQAASIIITSTVLGCLGGAVAGAAFAVLAQARSNAGMSAIVGAILLGLVGYSRGRERAFKLKLEAQIALCQVQIEKNTSASKS